ncbi:hypothetical protein GCM10027570_40230 [Streptomonospora sediminis]
MAPCAETVSFENPIQEGGGSLMPPAPAVHPDGSGHRPHLPPPDRPRTASGRHPAPAPADTSGCGIPRCDYSYRPSRRCHSVASCDPTDTPRRLRRANSSGGR